MIVHSTTSSPSGFAMRMGPWSETEHVDEYLELIDQFQRAAARRSPARIPSAGPIRPPRVLTA